MKKSVLLLLLASLIMAGCNEQKATETEPTAQPAQLPEIPSDIAHPEPVSEAESSASAHSAKHALDWHGTYTGTIPCQDCEGIATTLIVTASGDYQLSQIYLGDQQNRIYSDDGQITWNDKGNTITVGTQQYFVAENRLIQLDQQGQRINGDLADFYQLQK
ncbi:copper resistance protein NlpE [Thaumasiovibrio subtropicus]|uniref:copper resistance protein NlpE n=1 Tax=Thaumasiovibrio subtropicus TaxID=1891207 RepID=UPI000B3643EB|nr:copper resistance protein NlpE [Thaumasiovibrio subtropicus]